MHDSKLILLLQKLPKKFFKRLGQATASPYFTKKADLPTFYEFLKSYYPLFDPQKITYEAAHQYVFPNKKFDKKEVGYLMSDLMKLTERLLAIEKMEEDAIMKELYLLDIFNEWNLDKAFNKTFKDALKVLEQSNSKESQYFYWNYSLNVRENIFFDRQKKHLVDNSIQKAMDNLDLFYFAQKLKYCCEMVNRQKVVASEYEIHLMDEILNYLKDNPLAEEPIIAIYSTYLHLGKAIKENEDNEKNKKPEDRLLINEKERNYFKQLNHLLHQYIHLFSRGEAKGMFILLSNYCVRKIHKGLHEFEKDLFTIYQTMLEQDLVLENNYISPWSYMNIITLGVRINLEWTEKFIHSYSEFLSPNFKENAYNYNLAYLYFSQKKYDDAMSLLNKVVYNDVFYNCEARALLMRIYYKKEETSLLSALAESFRIYLRRNKIITDKRKTLYLNFIKSMSRLDRIIRGDNKILEKLYSDVQNTTQVYNREWILNEIEAKMKRRSMG